MNKNASQKRNGQLQQLHGGGHSADDSTPILLAVTDPKEIMEETGMETGMDTEEAVPHEHFWYWKIFATTCITVIWENFVVKIFS